MFLKKRKRKKKYIYIYLKYFIIFKNILKIIAIILSRRKILTLF